MIRLVLLVSMIMMMMMIASLSDIAAAYNGVLIVEGGQKLNLTTLDVKTGDVNQLLVFPQTGGFVLPLTYQDDVLAYITYPYQPQLIYLNTQTGTIEKSFNLPPASSYGFNMIDGSLDKSFSIKSPTFIDKINGVNLQMTFDFTTNRAIVWFNAFGLNDKQQHEQEEEEEEENVNGEIITCKITQGCNYLFGFDLRKQQVISSVDLGVGFSYNQIIEFGTLSGDYIIGVTAKTSYHPLSAMQLDISSGKITYTQPSFGLDTYYTNIVSGFQDGLAFVLAINAWSVGDPTYFMVYDLESNQVLSNSCFANNIDLTSNVSISAAILTGIKSYHSIGRAIQIPRSELSIIVIRLPIVCIIPIYNNNKYNKYILLFHPLYLNTNNHSISSSTTITLFIKFKIRHCYMQSNNNNSKMMVKEMIKEQAKVLQKEWDSNPRWSGVQRDYTAEDVIRLRGSCHEEYSVAKRNSQRLWTMMNDKTSFVPALGALTGNQAIQMVRGGLKAIYLSGWQVAADNNTSGQMYPDQSLYAVNSVPELVRRINNSLRRRDQIEWAEGNLENSYLDTPIVADAEAGFGGPLNAFELMKAMIEAGAAGVHWEDQLASEKKCGHMGGKVCVPTSQHIRTLNSARLASDVMGVPTLIVARTDSLGASLLTSDVDERDKKHLNGKRTVEGYYEVNKGIQVAIDRALAYAPYADVLWMETSTPSIELAKKFADAIHAKYPNKLLAYNCSPSFHWKQHLSTEQIATFQQQLSAMGYKFQFITLAGFHALNLAMFELAREYSAKGMPAYVSLQEREFDLEKVGYTATRHQREVGTGYFDSVTQVVSGGKSSTLALVGSTEQEQFDEHIEKKKQEHNLSKQKGASSAQV
ncbi:isocitrate lyase [Cavenderia fasciculata]|uniref:isocitrate lyase n=1 Tax=Cavenderia fasciculata TaxID=261658 RepID=F4PQW8_CACFS|nr:isocitrate lyase [Cavenderia fasciculata]EGG21233.1 isocitrate lyase [Cavenderia fasciculata]|eukprot:XP_004359083.1 isocitrate lyase [Cavenderia fasciculata]